MDSMIEDAVMKDCGNGKQIRDITEKKNMNMYVHPVHFSMNCQHAEKASF